MKPGRTAAAVAMTALFVTSWAAGQQEDLRLRYGVRRLETALHIQAAIQADGAKRLPEALRAVEAALALEPDTPVARYWRATVLGHMGRMDESQAEWARTATRTQPYDVTLRTEAAVNRAINSIHLKDIDDARYWFSYAILMDPDDRGRMHWKAYRNMAIALFHQKQFLSAGLCSMLGREADPEHVPAQQAKDFLDQAGPQEVARMLFWSKEAAAAKPPAKRAAATVLKETAPADEPIDDAVTGLWPDPAGRFVVALAADKPYYYLLRTGPRLTAAKTSVDGAVRCGAMVDGRLFLAVASPARLVQVDPATGRQVKAWPLDGGVPDTVAVFPALDQAFFPVKDGIRRLRLDSGRIEDTGQAGMHVLGDPRQRFLYAYLKDDPREATRTATVWVGARPVTVMANTGSVQSVFLQYAVTPGKLLPAQIRLNAAANATALATSQDGQWASIIGGGGWMSPAKPRGYVIPVFDAEDLDHVQNVFFTDNWPLNIAFNPVTDQVAAIREKDATIYSLADRAKLAQLAGPFARAAAFSGDGQWLILACKGKGLRAFRNALSPAELKRGGAWSAGLKAEPFVIPGGQELRPPGPPDAALASFRVLEDKAAVLKRLDEAIARGGTALPLSWRHVEGIGEGSDVTAAFDDIVRRVGEKSGTDGLGVYLATEALKKRPDCPPLMMLLGQTYVRVGRYDEAADVLLKAIRLDAGRTSVASCCLNVLALSYYRREKPWPAIHCLAATLAIDRCDPEFVGNLRVVLEENGLKTQLEALDRQFKADWSGPR